MTAQPSTGRPHARSGAGGAAVFSLRVPPSWFEFDLWRATHTGDLARLVEARIGEDPRLKPLRGPLVRALREAAEQAERQGAVLCAAMTDPVAQAGLLAAVLTVFHTDGAPDPADNRVEAIAAQITTTAPEPGSGTWRQVELLEQPAGRSVRVHGVEATELGRGTLNCATMQTLTPVPDGSGILNVVLTSPQTELAEPLFNLFDAISSTLTWSLPSF